MNKVSRLRKAAMRILTLGLVSALMLLVAEGICWIVLDPVDFLKPTTVKDPILGMRLEPGSAGHDALGYRNKSVPKRADIVVIGDSQTYGVSAKASDSWPAQLSELTGRRVYNLALGGYGPVHYSYVLEHKAIALQPSLVVIGLYLGNDLYDAISLVYRSDHWAHLRQSDVSISSSDFPAHIDAGKTDRKKTLGGLRDWLARRSILYRLATHSVLGDMARRAESRNAMSEGSNDVVLDLPQTGIFTVLTPRLRVEAMDSSSLQIGEGLRLSLAALTKMKQLCTKKGIRLLVALIPTKELVYSVHTSQSRSLQTSEVFAKMVELETTARKAIMDHLSASNIKYIDFLPAMQDGAKTQNIYPGNRDGHPNRLGYGIIAETIRKQIAK